MIKTCAKKIRLLIFKIKFRKRNRHNFVTAETYFPLDNVTIGKQTYGPLNVIWMTPKNAHLKIGHYCSIGPNVKFLVGGEHDYSRISTYPFQTLIYKEKTNKFRNLDICVEDDVWIGYDALIMSGVNIGKGSVIGARSIVTKDVPPYSVYVGNKVIKTRFSSKIIEKLQKIDYSKIEHSYEDEYKQYCQCTIDENNVEKIIKIFCTDKEGDADIYV